MYIFKLCLIISNIIIYNYLLLYCTIIHVTAYNSYVEYKTRRKFVFSRGFNKRQFRKGSKGQHQNK